MSDNKFNVSEFMQATGEDLREFHAAVCADENGTVQLTEQEWWQVFGAWLDWKRAETRLSQPASAESEEQEGQHT